MKRWLVSFVLEKIINILPEIWARAGAEFEQIHVLREISEGSSPAVTDSVYIQTSSGHLNICGQTSCVSKRKWLIV